MKSERIGAVRRASAKDAPLRSGSVAPRMHAQDITTSAMQPSEDEDLVPDPQPLQTFEQGRLEGEPRVRSALVALLRGRRRVRQLGLDPSDRL